MVIVLLCGARIKVLNKILNTETNVLFVTETAEDIGSPIMKPFICLGNIHGTTAYLLHPL